MMSTQDIARLATSMLTAQDAVRKLPPLTSDRSDFDLPSAYAVADQVMQARSRCCCWDEDAGRPDDGGKGGDVGRPLGRPAAGDTQSSGHPVAAAARRGNIGRGVRDLNDVRIR